MDLWLLAAGAILLLVITAWIVWSARPEENISMRSNPEPPDPQDVPPQGDRFEDQYTSATGDLSAGGVAEAFAHPEPTGSDLTQPATQASAPEARPDQWRPPAAGREGTGDVYQTPVPTSHSYPRAPVVEERSVPMVPISAMAVFSVGGAVAGIVLYRRWQERNKPVNRFRRRARDVAGRLSDRLPDVEDLPAGAAPKGGAAAAVLLASVALARALRGGSDEDEGEDERNEQQQRVLGYLDRLPWRELLASVDWASLMRDLPDADEARERGKRALRDVTDTDRFGKRGKRLAQQLPSADDIREQRSPAIFGLGFGGLAAVAGAGYLIWRVIKG